jgi:hypothetical protein
LFLLLKFTLIDKWILLIANLKFKVDIWKILIKIYTVNNEINPPSSTEQNEIFGGGGVYFVRKFYYTKYYVNISLFLKNSSIK